MRRTPAPRLRTTRSGRLAAGGSDVNLEVFSRSEYAQRAEPQDYTRTAVSRPVRPHPYPRTASRRVLPALNEGALEAAIAMLSPVRGLRP